MALRTPLPVQPNLYMTDTAGRPLDNGQVFFGQENKDPELYPINVFYDDLFTIAASQPVRTKNGFLNQGNNTVGIYAAELNYSVKVLDQHGKQVLYIKNISRYDFDSALQSEIARSKQESQEIKDELAVKAQQISGVDTRLTATKATLEGADAVLQGQIDGIGGGKFAYTTYAKMEAAAALPAEDPLKLSPNSSVDIINDPDPNKNGTYGYDGTTITKSPYDPATISKNYTDDKVDQFIETKPMTGLAWVVVDDNGNVGASIDNNGNFDAAVIRDIKADIEAIQGGGSTGAKDVLTQQKTDLMHIFSYGQSLSRGVYSAPVISTTQPYSNLTFTSGVLSRYDTAHDYSAFKPLIEQTVGSESETPVSGMLNNFVRMRVARGEQATNWQFVGSATGYQGKTITQLIKPTPIYNGMVAQVQAAYDLAQAQDKTYSVWAMSWTQGENDYAGVGQTQAYYLGALLGLRDDFNTDVKAITAQSFNVPIVMYQTAGHRHTNYQKDTMQIALAQLQAANENDDMILACPIYNLPHHTDNLHLTNDSSYQLGRYYAKALEYSLFSGEKWQPLQPKNIIKQGKIIDIEFNKSDLVIDTTLVAATHNMGFDLWNGNTLLDTITSVTVTDSNRVRLVLSAVPAVGTLLSYGRGRTGDPAAAGNITGSRGNLRDSAGDTDNYTDSNGVTRYMHNFCAMFEKTL